VIRRGGTFIVVAVVAVSMLSGCGSKPAKALPSIVGVRLDAAHKTLKSAGFKKYQDHDTVGSNRSIDPDHDWVVVRTEPSGSVKTSAKITLEVAKADPNELSGLLPATTPIVEELVSDAAAKAQKASDAAAAKAQRASDSAVAKAQQASADAAKKQQDIATKAQNEAAAAQKKKQDEAAKAAQSNADRLAAVNLYISLFNSLVPIVNKALAGYDQINVDVSNGGSRVVAAQAALAAQDFFEIAAVKFTEAKPGSKADLSGVNNQLSDSMSHMLKATSALLDSLDTLAPTDIAESRRERDAGVSEWNATLTRIYGAAGKPAPVYAP
jgi:multidrug efflux pump subunit AcrA (membrane-fusion protein)